MGFYNFKRHRLLKYLKTKYPKTGIWWNTIAKEFGYNQNQMLNIISVLKTEGDIRLEKDVVKISDNGFAALATRKYRKKFWGGLIRIVKNIGIIVSVCLSIYAVKKSLEPPEESKLQDLEQRVRDIEYKHSRSKHQTKSLGNGSEVIE